MRVPKLEPIVQSSIYNQYGQALSACASAARRSGGKNIPAMAQRVATTFGMGVGKVERDLRDLIDTRDALRAERPGKKTKKHQSLHQANPWRNAWTGQYMSAPEQGSRRAVYLGKTWDSFKDLLSDSSMSMVLKSGGTSAIGS